MATLDGFHPYPLNVSAEQARTGIHNGLLLPETLKPYTKVINSITPPTIDNVHNSGILWYNEKNAKTYRAAYNDVDGIVVWFEI